MSRPAVPAILLLTLLGACEKEDHCDGNVAVECHSSEGYGIGEDCSRIDCGTSTFGAYCRELGDTGDPQCVLEPEPRAACGGRGVNWICEGSQAIQCEDGYARVITECGDPALCAPVGGIGCTARPGLDAGCMAAQAAGRYTYCDGSVAVTCASGYAITADDCGAPELCYSTLPNPDDTPFDTCVVSLDIDPRCHAERGRGDYHFCEGEVAFHCIDDHLQKIEDCAAQGMFCTSSGYCNDTDY